MWIIAVIVIGGLVVLGGLLLSIPFDLAFKLEVYGKSQLYLRWYWFFGLLSRELKTEKPPLEKKPAVRRRFNLTGTLRSIRTGLELMRTRGLMRQFWRLMKGLFRSISIRNLEADFLVGLDDPAETFYIFALTEPVNRLLDHFQPYPVSIRPSFIGPVFEGFARGTLRLYPIRSVPPLLQFIFSPPGFRLMKKTVALRWRKNKP